MQIEFALEANNEGGTYPGYVLKVASERFQTHWFSTLADRHSSLSVQKDEVLFAAGRFQGVFLLKVVFAGGFDSSRRSVNVTQYITSPAGYHNEAQLERILAGPIRREFLNDDGPVRTVPSQPLDDTSSVHTFIPTSFSYVVRAGSFADLQAAFLRSSVLLSEGATLLVLFRPCSRWETALPNSFSAADIATIADLGRTQGIESEGATPSSPERIPSGASGARSDKPGPWRGDFIGESQVVPTPLGRRQMDESPRKNLPLTRRNWLLLFIAFCLGSLAGLLFTEANTRLERKTAPTAPESEAGENQVQFQAIHDAAHDLLPEVLHIADSVDNLRGLAGASGVGTNADQIAAMRKTANQLSVEVRKLRIHILMHRVCLQNAFKAPNAPMDFLLERASVLLKSLSDVPKKGAANYPEGLASALGDAGDWEDFTDQVSQELALFGKIKGRKAGK